MTVTNILLPFMIHGDRFILGVVGTLAMVTYYITPAELIVRLLVLPRALVTVLFPNFTIGYATDTEGIPQLVSQSLRLLLGALTVGGALLIPFGPYALGLWLGPEFQTESGMVLRWLTIGITFLSLAYIPRFLIQASGKPRVTAILCLCEVPLYLALALYGARHGGATGIAMAWTFRCLVHLISLSSFATPQLPGLRKEWRSLLPRIILSLSLLILLILLPQTKSTIWMQLPVPFLAAAWVWWGVFHEEERNLLLHPLRRRLHASGS
jgi:O-antigen/teichoic acid export membrane protein